MKNYNTDVVLINLNGPLHMTSNYLHALLKREGILVKTIHFREYEPRSEPPTNNELEILSNLIKEINPKIINISVNSMNYFDAKDITEKIRGELGIPFIWGGPHTLVMPEESIKIADFICRGEGDVYFPELIKKFIAGEDCSKVPNIWIKRGLEVIKNEFGPLVKDLDMLPFPDYSDVDKYYLIDSRISTKYEIPSRKYVYQLMTSRGCPFRCSYCMNSLIFNLFHNKFLRKRGVNSVIEELVQVKKMHPKLKTIYFWDDVFVMDLPWLKEFAKVYKEKINIPFFCYCHPMFVKDETIKILKWMGVKMIFIGIESGSPRVRREIYDRHETNDKIIEAATIINKHKIKVHYDIITSKFDTLKDFDVALHLLLNLPKPFHINHNNLAYYPGFKITNLALQEKIISKQEVAGYSRKIRTQYATKNEFENNPELAYYYLIGRKFIPNQFIFWLYSHESHLKHKSLFGHIPSLFESFDNNLHALNLMFKLLSYGEFKFVFFELKKRFFK
ncbi:hypothetical protein COY27_01555 [Candidatus Woesearchaeota archaeon CG_4_10_14_0_2_um_filter_33_13]|nr:MAG: hypothetical protein COY27_01555 [Candidatus Woesearchaeota archaeon CG_4_10_14_0_2_um_filter_33_13]